MNITKSYQKYLTAEWSREISLYQKLDDLRWLIEV